MVTVWGLPLALSVIETDPGLFPRAVGVNVTVTVHEAAALIVVMQLLVWEYSPEVVMEVMTSGLVPVFLTVTFSERLDPIVSLPKLRELGERETVWAKARVDEPSRKSRPSAITHASRRSVISLKETMIRLPLSVDSWVRPN
jgi:hypothetical protein